MNTRSIWPWLFCSIFLPNVFLYGIAEFFSIGRPFFNIDYVFIGLFIVAFRNNPILLGLSFLFLLLFLLFDLFLLIGQVFLFIRVQDVFYIIKFIFLSSIDYLLIALIFILICSVCMSGFVCLRRLGELSEGLIIFNIFLAVYAYHVYFSDGTNDRFWRVSTRKIVDSQVVYWFTYRDVGFINSHFMEEPIFSKKPSADVTYSIPVEDNARVMLIISESWGEVREKEINNFLLSPITQLRDRLDWYERGSLDVKGPTVAGELRELCRLRPNHFNLRDVTEGFDYCLPNQLRKAGYKTAAMHGAMGLMYDRIHWYPRLGFDEVIFFESKIWPRRCYSFPGACDLDLIEEVKQYFSEPGKRFFYWLTLNSHSTYDQRDIREDFFDCAAFNVRDGQACRNLKLHAQFFNNLGRLIQDDSMKGVEIFVIGDHAPPIFDQDEFNEYFQEGQVSWLHFKIRD